MAKDVDKLIRIFDGLTSYQPLIGPAPTQPMSTHPPSWAIGVGVELPAPMPMLTGPPPPWPFTIMLTPDMQRDRDWLVQHPDLRDTDEYRTVHDRLAEQLGLSPDTLEPLRSSPLAPRPATSLPTEQTAEPPPRVESDASETAPKPESKPPVEAANIASVTGVKKRKRGAGNKPKLTEEQAIELQQALRQQLEHDPATKKHDVAIAWLQRHAVPKIKTKDGKKLTVGDSTLYRHVTSRVLGNSEIQN